MNFIAREDGWKIEYDAYRTVDRTDLPGKVVLRSPQLDLKLLVEHWSTTGMER